CAASRARSRRTARCACSPAMRLPPGASSPTTVSRTSCARSPSRSDAAVLCVASAAPSELWIQPCTQPAPRPAADHRGEIMETTVRIPTPLRTLTGGNDEVKASGATVAEVIEDLEKKHPGIRDRLLDAKGVRRFINIYVGEEDIRFLDGL